MATYSISSFAPNFFTGSPTHTSDTDYDSAGNPRNVMAAIKQLRLHDPVCYREVATIVLGVRYEDFDRLGALDTGIFDDSIFDCVIDTDTCSGLQSPVEVWIDRDGDYQLLIWD